MTKALALLGMVALAGCTLSNRTIIEKTSECESAHLGARVWKDTDGHIYDITCEPMQGIFTEGK